MKVTVFWRRIELREYPQKSDLSSVYTDIDSVVFENGFLHMTKADGSSRHISAGVIESWEEER